MNLYLISQDENNDYDTYDSAVVAAPDVDTARKINPHNGQIIRQWKLSHINVFEWPLPCSAYWCDSPDKVKVRYIGIAAEGMTQGVICASFNQG